MRLLLCGLLLTAACAAPSTSAAPPLAMPAVAASEDGTREVTVEWRGVI